ncbi:oxidoreductase, short chain dehydrogenase/reductase domain protein [Candidatus Nitrosopelagicus brevis]|uniref:Oxidoreductase, short chain dehydrogenase/reductase domain protein n=2 Tax=Candidatus Nitrosopelagicus brevis TaxID=1410606 RepID=A0A0A7UYU8_9ARCH|nr:SDR family NAD(P)-dependent oxidoreductase [Candidatus Nitrosopelagicus brevis]AJA91962.1 oxidoreductase, short chain dehydrogenase/reductase domain protein [Candidatus Nitrosopelagicus brevis]
MKFENKVVLITGSGTGIGMTVAKKFVENGASVVILGRRKEPLDSTSEMLTKIINEKNSKGFVKIFSGVDVSDEKSVTEMFDALKNEGINIDVIVNNAGVSGPVTCFPHAPLEDFRSTVDIHLTGTFWTSVQALKVMKEGGKIITISTFFAEERPLEQRPYRFRGPYTASQGAKNRLVEAMSWELTEKGIISIGTNPGPVHSDRIYKTVYPKAASEFLRVSGFEDLTPAEVEAANKEIVGLLGEDEDTIKNGIKAAAEKLGKQESTFTNLLNKVQSIAEKIQKNTSTMIADQQFLSQDQVATTVLTLSDDQQAKILNGKIIPGDRVFYPVRSHITSVPETVKQYDYSSKIAVLTIDATDEEDAKKAEEIATNVQANGGQAICFISDKCSKEIQDSIGNKFHSHVIDFSNNEEITRWFNTAKSKGDIEVFIHITGKVPTISKLTELSRSEWDELTDKFINIPATVSQNAMGIFVPNGSEDPRLFKDAKGRIVIIGPDLPHGKKIGGGERAKVEVFRGALRPFATTINQELSDVLKSNVRTFLVLAGTVDGKEPNNARITDTVNYLISDDSKSSAEVIFCPDESR